VPWSLSDTAPASLRVVKINDDFLAVGAFAYMCTCPDSVRQLDIRGGELPMTLFQRDHAGFSIMRTMVDGIVDNWLSYDVAQLIMTLLDQVAPSPE